MSGLLINLIWTSLVIMTCLTDFTNSSTLGSSAEHEAVAEVLGHVQEHEGGVVPQLCAQVRALGR